MKQCGQEIDNFKELLKKTKDAKIMVAFRPCAYTQDTNQYCRQKS